MGQRLEKAAAIFDIPAETLPDVPKLTVTGNNCVQIENHRGIRFFSTDLIEVSFGKRVVRLRGSAFMLEKITPEELRIKGKLILAELD